MTDTATNVVPIVSRASRMADALQRARAQQQAIARDSLAQREGRLASLADELRTMADDLPAGDADRFGIVAANTGDRLLIDGISHVDLHPETGAYRLVRQRRDGPEVVTQSQDREIMADGVADYLAARIVEHEGLVGSGFDRAQNTASTVPSVVERRGLGFWGGVFVFLLGALCSATALFTYAWLQNVPG